MDTSKLSRSLTVEILGTADTDSLRANIVDENEKTVGILVLAQKVSKNTGSTMFWGQGSVVVDGYACSAQAQVVLNHTRGLQQTVDDVNTEDGEIVASFIIAQKSFSSGSAGWWGQCQAVVSGYGCSVQTQVVVNKSKLDKNSRANGPVRTISAA